jgi:hypothetical protein
LSEPPAFAGAHTIEQRADDAERHPGFSPWEAELPRDADSLLEEAVTSEPVSENSIPEAFWAVISRFWHRKWHKIARLACGRAEPAEATKLLAKMRLFTPVVDAGDGIYRL